MSIAPDERQRIDSLLRFWFAEGDNPRQVWWERNDEFDRACTERFMADHARAAAGELRHWTAEPDAALALVLLLDQLPRNLFRGTARAYASDAMALDAARSAVAAGHDGPLHSVKRQFLYLPFQHSEELADQDEAVRLFAALADHPEYSETLRIAERHREIIARFGRFPHRNAALGRATTPEEAAFLKEPESSF